MNRRLVVLSALVAVLSVSTLAEGQERGRGQGRRGGMMMGRMVTATMLLRSEAVRNEIDVTQQQAAQLRELVTADRSGMGNLREMSPEERREAMAELQKRMAEQEDKIKEILDKKQQKRLAEIRIQALGPAAIADEAVAKELGVTEEQKAKLADAREAMMNKLREAMSGDQRPDRDEMAKLRAEVDTAAKEILTEAQAAKLEKMKGKPFDVSQLRGQRGGGPSRGN